MEKRGPSGQHGLSDTASAGPETDVHLIIVALDGSALASHAVPSAASLAEELGVPLLLIQVLHLSSNDAARDEAAHRSQAEGYLNAMKRSLTTSGLQLKTMIDTDGAQLRALLNQCPHALLLTSKAAMSVASPLGRLKLAIREEHPNAVVVNDWS